MKVRLRVDGRAGGEICVAKLILISHVIRRWRMEVFGWLGNLGEIGGKAHGFSDVRNLSYHPHYEFQRWKKEEKVIQESFWSAVPSGP